MFMEAKIFIMLGHFTYIRKINYKIQGSKTENLQTQIQSKIHNSSNEDN